MRIKIKICMMLFLLLIVSCGKTGNSTDSSSLGFSLVFVKPATDLSKAVISQSPTNDPCIDYGITTVQGKVYDASNTLIKTGGPWQCSAHQGAFTNVPPGSGLTAVFEGIVGGNVAWRGQATNITINDNQSTTISEPIPMTYAGTDTIKPTVSSVSPSDAAANVPVTATIAATFSEAMSAQTIDASTFTVKTGSTLVAGSVAYNATTRTATFTASSNLAYATNYIVTIVSGTGNMGVKDLAWNSMGSDYYWSFTTAPDTTGPDTVSPVNTTVLGFINNNAASTSTASVTLSLSASDGFGVTAYFVAESPTTPAFNSAGWVVVTSSTMYSADVFYTLSSGSGSKIVYVWFKDAAGNVSTSMSDSISVSNTQYEIEPNNDFSTAQVISAGIEYIGQDNGSSDAYDYFKVMATGSSMTVNFAHVTQSATGSNFSVTIYNALQSQVGSFNANAGVDNSMTLGVSEGTYYYVRIYCGSTSYQYKLKATFP